MILRTLFKMFTLLPLKIYRIVSNCLYQRRNNIKIAKGSVIEPGVKIGRYTRINAQSHVGYCEIGSFCAIAGRLIVRSSDHYVNYLNMQDYFQRSVLKSDISVAGKTKGKVRIGHGVWIGDSVIILSGVTIGNGAVIGAGSVVTKPIPAYAIAVGSPARVVRYRFRQEVRELIDSIEWWTWSISKLKRNKFLFEKDLEEISEKDLMLLLGEIVD